ncbi:MAG TPA: AraC family transcriptional regulator ligand-binding domain-containing protein [Thermoanaerobaculia bacterium]|nr:AraC family transcriptional regulator ligand-binding domain-containing protein [Thermoanaerobaculia bacterium]
MRNKDMTARSTVAARQVCALLDFAVSRGAKRSDLLKRARIDAVDLRDADERIPFDRYVALMRAAKTACDDPALALHFGEAIDLEDISIVGMVNGGDSLAAGGFDLMNRYGRLDFDLMGDGAPRFVMRDSWLIDERPDSNDFPELTECTFARMACTIRRYFGDRPFLMAVNVTHAEPAYRAEYDRILQVPVTFGSDQNALVLAAGAWTARAPAARPISDYAASVMTAHADALLEDLAKSDSMRGRVESALLSILHTGEANVESIARQLGLSRQTLFRKLKAEGVTFEKVLDELRRTIATKYLRGKNATVAEAAYLVGFSDAAAFSRAFKRWTGSSPGSY